MNEGGRESVMSDSPNPIWITMLQKRQRCTRARLRGVSAGLATAALIVVLGDPARANLTVRGDRTAWSEVVAAYKALNLLSGYRVKMVWGGGSQTMLMEIVPPSGATRAVDGPQETITVNGESRIRFGDSFGWRCVHRALDTPLPFGPLEMQRDNRDITVEVTRGPDTIIDGAPVRTYVHTHSIQLYSIRGFPYKTTLYVGTQSGLPRRAVTVASHGGEQTIDYYDYGSKIEITLPPCK